MESNPKEIPYIITDNPNIYVDLMYPNSKAPERKRITDAGWDIFSRETTLIPAGGFKVVMCGIRLIIPRGYTLDLRGRSGLASRGIFSHYGTIDAEYRGEIGPILYNLSGMDYQVTEGDKVAQIVLLPIEQKLRMWDCSKQEFEEHPNFLTSRGDKGFGSSGK